MFLSKSEIKQAVDVAAKQLIQSGLNGGFAYAGDNIPNLYVLAYHQVPNSTTIDKIQPNETVEILKKEFPMYYILSNDEEKERVIFFYNFVIVNNSFGASICVYYNDLAILERIKSLKVDQPEEKKYIGYVTHNSMGFTSTYLEVKKQDVDLTLNYNDDLPHDKIVDIINNDQSGLLILHGAPGTGKTSYIRSLIYSTKQEFLFMDSSTFNYITDASFIDLLAECSNSVFILEDCEDLLADRDNSLNYKISALLNLADGIIGDSLKLKFICTFNSDLNKMDKALLRKGRLKMKYEFKKLTKEKSTKLLNHLGCKTEAKEEMSLAEIYNYEEENGADKIVERKTVGFRQ